MRGVDFGSLVIDSHSSGSGRPMIKQAYTKVIPLDELVL
jgi:hypothetical protein